MNSSTRGYQEICVTESARRQLGPVYAGSHGRLHMMTMTGMPHASALDMPGIVADSEMSGGSVAVTNRSVRRAAARSAGLSTMDGLLGQGWLERSVAEVRQSGWRWSGPDSFLAELVKEVLEAGLAAELTEHLGYAKHDPVGHHSGNSRNGSTPKTVQTEVGPVRLDVPRGRAGSFEPVLLPKHETRLGGLSEIIISLY